MKNVLIVLFVCGIVCLAVYPAYSQEASSTPVLETKTLDINKDDNPDITYYRDENNIVKVEADTNYDDKTDVTVYTENGKFKVAEADTNYDGVMDKKFTDAAEFDNWLNENKPDFQDSLNKKDWSNNKFKF
jgi:hypothetical protein